MKTLRTLFVLIACLCPLHGSLASPALDGDETLLFFPTQAYVSKDVWTVPVKGWVYELEEDSIVSDGLIALFRKTFDNEFTEEQAAHFHSMVLPFLVDNERGKVANASFGGNKFELGPSTPDGNVAGAHTVGVEQLKVNAGEWREITVEAGGRSFSAPVQFVGPSGLSVVSDIDDTVKVTVIRDHDETLANTFVRPFRAVEGMGALYSRWAAGGAAIHYVSGSPRQLYEPLFELFEGQGFPRGGWYLRTVRINPRKISEALKPAAPIKKAKIEELFARYPKRLFILVGDSGESDPEIYGELYRSHPAQVACIFIRDVSGDKVGGARYVKAFSAVPPEKWRLFSYGGDLERYQLPLLEDGGD